MIDIELLRTDPDAVRRDLKKRRDDLKLAWIDQILVRDKEWRQEVAKLQDLQRSRNTLSQQINDLKKQGKDSSGVLAEVKALPGRIQEHQAVCDTIKDEIDSKLMRLPNITHESVPYGKDSTENVVVRTWGKKKEFSFPLKNHAELAESLGVADFDRARKISGSGFYVLKGALAMLDQALVRYAIDHLAKKGYILVEPPFMMRHKPYAGVTDLADFENVMYKIAGEDEYLIATSEHPLCSMHMDEAIPEECLPIRYVGLSQCFRKEVGAHGLDEKGLFRVHQFTKVEQVIFCRPEDSWDLHEELLKNAEELFQGLDLHYRVVNICTGDLGIVAAKKYDLEAWLPRAQEYKEVVSGSNCTDWQARRLNIKCGKEGGSKRTLHTLNCTAIATSRALVAILENYQNADGSVTVPKILQPYMNGLKVIESFKERAFDAKAASANPQSSAAQPQPSAMRSQPAASKLPVKAPARSSAKKK